MISFIVPSHNYGYLLSNCILSILKNDKKFVKEILVVNDASEDNTDLVIRKLRKKSKKIKYFKKNFRNLAKTVNFGVLKTKGNVICKIDPDDSIKKIFAKKVSEFYLKSNADFVYSNIIVNDTEKGKRYVKKQYVSPIFKKFIYPHGSGCIFKKKLWKKVGGFNQNSFYQDDYDFWLKVNKLSNIKIHYLNEALYIYNKHGNNMSNNKIKKNLAKIKIFLINLFKR